MKKFYVGTSFHGQHTVRAYNVCEAAFKVKQKIPSYDGITYVDYYDGKKYIRNIPGETFDEWTEEDYEEFLYDC